MAEPIADDGQDLDPSAVVTRPEQVFDKYSLASVEIVRGCVEVKWLTFADDGSTFNNSFRFENTEAVLDEEGQEIEPAKLLWDQFKAQQAFIDFIALIQGALRQQGKV